MNLQEFINKYTGKKVDWDGAFGAQCVDLFRFYVKEVWGKPQTPGVIGAYQIFDSLPKGYEKVKVGQGLPKPGDVVTWNQKYVKNGHVAVVTKLISGGFESFDQNNPTGSACRISNHNYKNVIGWFRPVQQLTKTFMQVTIVANKNNWTTLEEQLATVNDWFKTNSTNRLEIVFDVKHTNFSNIPIVPFQQKNAVDVNWYRQNITPLATGQATIFLMNPEDYPNGLTFGAMTYGDPQRPVRMEVAANEIDTSGLQNFILLAFHEICHALFFLTDQPDWNPAINDYTVHQYLYQDPPKRKELLDIINYQKLQDKLITIKGDNMAQIKSQAKGASRRIVLEAANLEEWKVLCKVYGKDPSVAEEVVN